MEQHALGRIDPEAGEQLGVAQRELDHLAQSLDGVAHTAHVVVIDDGAGIARFFELGAQLDLGILVDVDDALGAGRYDREADLGQRIGRCVEHAAHIGRQVLHRLLASGGDEVAGHDGLAEEIALQRLRRALQAHLAGSGREDHAGGRPRFGSHDLDVLARADLGIAALEAVEADDVEGLILVIGGHGNRHRVALAGDLDGIAFGDAQRLECRTRHAGDTLAAFLLAGSGDLEPHRLVFHGSRCIGIGHLGSLPSVNSYPVAPQMGSPCKVAMSERCKGSGEKPSAGKKKARLEVQPGLESLGRGCLKGRPTYAFRTYFVQVRKAHGLLRETQHRGANI